MNSQCGVVDSDDISNSVDNWKVLKPGCINNDLCPVLFILWVEGWINYFNRADESVAINFVWESSISDDTIEVDWVCRGERSFVQLNILVLCKDKFSLDIMLEHCYLLSSLTWQP